MGLFDVFKKKKATKEEITKQLDEAQDIGSMMVVLAQNGLISKPKDKYHNSFGQEITHLTEDGELPWGWIYANRDFTEPIEEQYRYLQDTYISAKKEDKGVRAVHAALKSFVTYMEDTKKLCESKGECFAEWSTLMVANDASIEMYRKDLVYMEENMDVLICKEKLVKQMKTDLLNIIKEEPGIVQADLYKRFDAELKGDVSSELYRLSASGVITREKSGRSYKLYLKQ